MPEYNSDASDLPSSSAGQAGDTWAPQFTAAEYGKRSSLRCALCSNFIFSEYFKANGQKLCATCAEQARSGISTSSLGSLSGALFFGLAGTIAGMAIYYAVTAATGWTIGYFGVFVGWIVGRAVIAGARGVGSFRIQLLAALLTYAAITLDALPAFLYSAYRRGPSLADLRSALEDVILPGLASPFARLNADPLNGGIHMLIIFLGIGVAWRLTRVKALIVAGPFNVKADGKA